ncbi:MAG: hypothetical protein ACXVQY_08240 [Actinomycetota bacterium]
MPEVRVVAGSPAPEHEEAARAAILELWRTDRAAAARHASVSAWVLAARSESTKRGALAGRGHPMAWRLSGRLRAMQATPTQSGRGDAK